MTIATTRQTAWLLSFSLATALCACSEDETPPNDALTVELQVTPDHLHSFETEATFRMTVTDGRGAPVLDFVTLKVELVPAGNEEGTRVLPLALEGVAYLGTTEFTANGSLDVRVVGQRPGQDAPVELLRRNEPIVVSRPHFDAGGYRVEFETSTGDAPVALKPTTYRFLIMEDAGDPRPPVTGLEGVTIRCKQARTLTEIAALESPHGTYTARHTFEQPGNVSVELNFPGSDGAPASVLMKLAVTQGPIDPGGIAPPPTD